MIASMLLAVALTGQCANGQCAVQARSYVVQAQPTYVQYQAVVQSPVVYAAPQAEVAYEYEAAPVYLVARRPLFPRIHGFFNRVIIVH